MGTRLDPALKADLKRFMAGIPRGDVWVYGYGSLMWSPGFRYAERQSALLYGYHRSLCVYSHQYRGTPERPGLVMGLCSGGSCWGVAFRVVQRDVRSTMDALWEREMPGRVYEPRIVPVRLARGTVRAVTFIADTAHGHFAGRLDVEETARLVAQGHGQRGRNIEYLANTVAHMEELGIREGHLHEVLAAVQGRAGSN